MPLSADERMSFFLFCPKCHQGTEKPVAWLAAHERLPCATPNCGGSIELQTGGNRDIVDKLSDYCIDLDEAMK
jgi:hypothetical protein